MNKIKSRNKIRNNLLESISRNIRLISRGSGRNIPAVCEEEGGRDTSFFGRVGIILAIIAV